MKSPLIVLVAFLAGFCVMTLEIAGNKYLSPLFGNSIFTWSSLIAIVLLSASVGGFFGGYRSDKSNPYILTVLLLLAASIYSIIDPYIFQIIKHWNLLNTDIIYGPLFASFILFSIPAFFLGAISPICIKILAELLNDENDSKVDKPIENKVGSSAGIISMSGALGSFFGTILTGFLFIPNFSTKEIFTACGILISCFSILILLKFKTKFAEDVKIYKTLMAINIIIIIISIFTIKLNIKSYSKVKGVNIYSESNFYHDINIYDRKLNKNLTLRTLTCDTTSEGAEFVETENLYFNYQKYWQLCKLFYDNNLDNINALYLGAGAYGIPKKIANYYPNSQNTIIEIDNSIIEIGKKYFNTKKSQNIHSVNKDARLFLRMYEKNLDKKQTKKKYDLIISDAYNGVRHIPIHLTTVEFFTLAKKHMNKNGIFFTNIISQVTGNHNKVFLGFYKTLKKVFKNVYIFSVEPNNLNLVQNIILIASDKDLNSKFTKNNISKQKNNEILNRIIDTRIDNKIRIDNKTKNINAYYDEFNQIDKYLANHLLNSF